MKKHGEQHTAVAVVDPVQPKPPSRPMTLEQVAVEARHELAQQRPSWNLGVSCYRGQVYYCATHNADDSGLVPLSIFLPGTGPLTADVLPNVKAQITARIKEREDAERKRLRH